MKIAYFVHDYNRHAGHSRYVAELASRFKLDHEVHVFANTWEEKDPGGITFHKVPAIASRELLKVLSFVIPATLMAPKGFDIIHSQGLCGLRHDLTTAHFIQPVWLRELKIRGKKPSVMSTIWRLLVCPLEKYALGQKCSRRVITISKGVTEDLAREYSIDKNVDLIYHGVELDKFHPAGKCSHRKIVRDSLGISELDFVALYVGNLQKGACAAIRAISLIPDAKLVLVSGSDNGNEKELCRQLGIVDRVIWVPKSKEVEKIFSASDCFVFPTVYEPFGMVISEAMACGLPVVTSKAAGAADLIKDGDTGLLVEDSWDSRSIARHLYWLMKNPEARFAMGERARGAIEPYTWDKCAKETMACYLRILDERAALKPGKS
jgi:UDP-glucose:(heptosyl)LPS alpha-1,3-glucosyltransferase